MPLKTANKETPLGISGGAVRWKPAAPVAILSAIFLATLATVSSADAASRSKPDQIKYEYITPKDPAHQAIHDQMKQGQALEHLKQLLSPLRLPYPLTLKLTACDGIINAFYNDEVITVCYELLAEI